MRIAKLKKQAFGKSSEKIEREIERLELAHEDLQVAMTEAEDAPPDESDTGEARADDEIDAKKRASRRPMPSVPGPTNN